MSNPLLRMIREYDPAADLWPTDHPNPIVWCERCRRRHRLHTFTRGDYDRVIGDAAKQLSDEIDRRTLAAIVQTQ